MTFLGFLLIYLLGGFTFLPLLICAVLLHAYLTLPKIDKADRGDPKHGVSSITRPGDDVAAVEKAKKDLADKFKSRPGDGGDVAAGFFAVCREYVPGGVNGKPPERTTPAGSTVVQPKSDSVYQSIYRGIFDRKPNNNPLDNKSSGKPQRRGGNVFYVVLRHGHLMLFDDDEQLEVRHVVALAHHDVSITNGGDRIPEGELWIKRNAICLTRKTDAGEVTVDGTVSKPFFLFSENCSDKEDFYFALLRNQEHNPNSKNNPPTPLLYDVKHCIDLVQKLHSSEEHMQTRWINALLGRIFLALYKTSDIENYIRAKVTKKISRVKTPSFLSGITLRKVDMGEGAPYLTNPRLKDLTVDGECVVEADVKYTGNFRLEVAATARIELGGRFKPREVNVVLAVVLRKIEGHALVRIKAPPSNRLWMSFQTMPKMEMTIEPIVSSRQITYTLILRQIENRIKEVFAETLVYPNWDDSPFSHTEFKKWRGGIWADAEPAPKPPDLESAAATEGKVDQVKDLEKPAETSEPQKEPQKDPQPVERSMSVPALDASLPGTLYSRKAAKSTASLKNTKSSGSSTGTETSQFLKDRPKSMRTGSFSRVAPVVSTETVNVDAYKNTKIAEQSDAASGLAALSARSQNSSPVVTPVGSPSRTSNFEERGSMSSKSSIHSKLSEKSSLNELTPQPSLNIPSIVAESSGLSSSPVEQSPVNGSKGIEHPEHTKLSETIKSLGGDLLGDNSPSSSSSKSVEPDKAPASEKRLSLSVSAMTSVAATAKRWGLNALQKQRDSLAASRDQSDPNVARPDTSVPMGRGRPLPPPGVPLPPPDKKTKTAPIPVPMRKPLASPPTLPLQNAGNFRDTTSQRGLPPALPKRRTELDIGERNGNVDDDGMLVVAAPRSDSEPASPTVDEESNHVQLHGEDVGNEDLPMSGFSSFKSNDGRNKVTEDGNDLEEVDIGDLGGRPRLPRRRPGKGKLDDGDDFGLSESLPGWVKADEEESKKKSMWVDDDGRYQ